MALYQVEAWTSSGFLFRTEEMGAGGALRALRSLRERGYRVEVQRVSRRVETVGEAELEMEAPREPQGVLAAKQQQEGESR